MRSADSPSDGNEVPNAPDCIELQRCIVALTMKDEELERKGTLLEQQFELFKVSGCGVATVAAVTCKAGFEHVVPSPADLQQSIDSLEANKSKAEQEIGDLQQKIASLEADKAKGAQDLQNLQIVADARRKSLESIRNTYFDISKENEEIFWLLGDLQRWLLR
jgi:chromosome segregation ATPase